MDENEVMSALGRVCGLTIGLVLGLLVTWSTNGLDALEYTATSLCMTAVSEAGGDASQQCTPTKAQTDVTPALWAAVGAAER